ncbi:MAG TPA: Re/Si-specific NAD(P)(+) transhydrogenase subunit alpha [Actinomycetota bacterium]|jgi:NAD(P) transhydrogenase subunit alpha|nr:Re/Si-specific NAD(P)(+) transhydrogenase subunit alpha [Actinomycetota bacterium]
MADEQRLTVGVPTESFPGEARVALVPATLPSVKKPGMEIVVQTGAGEAAGFLDEAYADKGARILDSRKEVFAAADIIVQVRTFGSNPDKGKGDLDLLRPGQVLVGFSDPLSNAEGISELAKSEVSVFAMELMPRITRAQSMDALSSQATVGGYKAVVLAAGSLPKMFPMLTTAAGTIRPARVFVVGAGVAGLQAIATARRLGAVVEAYDVRPAVKEQVQSVGAKFVELDLDTGEAEDTGGYAKKMDEEILIKQREMMTRVVAANDVVITTAAIPGQPAPVLITGEMVAGMQPGSVIVDLAAERGGNCELTRPDEVVVEHGVTIHGPTNLPATVPFHASSMYSKNVATFLLTLAKDGKVNINMEDQIIRDTLLTRDGEVVHPRIRRSLGLEELTPEVKPAEVPAAPPGELSPAPPAAAPKQPPAPAEPAQK